MTWLTDPPSGLQEPIVVAHSEKEDLGDNGLSASVILRCPWEDRYEVFNNIIEHQLEWPYMDPGSDLIALNGGIAPVGGIRTLSGADPNLNYYVEAQLSINFGFLNSSDAGGGGKIYYSETLEPHAEFVKINPKRSDGFQVLFWSTGLGEEAKVTDEQAPNRLELGFDYTVRYMRLTTIPAEVLTHVGKVNDGPVVSPSLGLIFDAETLLFNQPSISRSISTNLSDNFWNMEVRWSWRPNTWNKWWRPSSGTYDEMIYSPESGPDVTYKNYPLADMSGLLP